MVGFLWCGELLVVRSEKCSKAEKWDSVPPYEAVIELCYAGECCRAEKVTIFGWVKFNFLRFSEEKNLKKNFKNFLRKIGVNESE